MSHQSATIALPEGGAITIELENITPQMAAGYLTCNLKNRKPKPRQVEILKRDMLAGAWNLTHQGIAFGAANGDGITPLLDGQHRLLAIVAADKPVPCLVFRGLPLKAQEATDMGQARSLSENLSLYDGEVNTNALVSLVNATAQCWARYDNRVSLPQVRQILGLLPKLRLLAAVNSSKYPAPFTMSSVRAVCGIAVHQWEAGTAAFYDAYQMGLRLTENHPAHHLRNYCLSLDGTGFKQRQQLFSYAADCLEKHILGTPMTSAKATGTGVPWLRSSLEEKYKQLRTILRLA